MKRNRKYWVKYPRGFANEYRLRYTQTPEEAVEAIVDGWERITRARALELAARKDAYNDGYILPWSGYDGDPGRFAWINHTRIIG